MKQIDCRQAGQKTDNSGETDQSQIVLGRQAGKYPKHRTTPVWWYGLGQQVLRLPNVSSHYEAGLTARVFGKLVG
jgi:hypothetical protein